MFLDENLLKQYKTAVRTHINEFSIWRALAGEKIPAKKKGHHYTWQFYLARTTTNKWMNFFISMLLLDLIHDEYLKRPFQLGGLESDGVPIALGMVQASVNVPGMENLSFFRIRKKPKEYGLGNIIEGIPDPNLPVVFVDDLVSSKITSFNAYHAMMYENFEVLPFIAAIVNKTGSEMKTDPNKMTKEDVFTRNNIDMNVKSIFNLDDFEFLSKPTDHFRRQGVVVL